MRRRGRSGGLVVAVVAGCFTSACDEPLVPPEEIEDLRVLAARAEVVGEPERATPRPGEEVIVRVLAADPDGDAVDASWALLACEAEATTAGLPRCRRELGRALSEGPGLPTLTFAAPSDGVERLAVIGVVCDGGAPRLSADVARVGCVGGARAAPFTFRVSPAADPADDNRNPPLPATPVRLDGEEWAPSEGDPCDPGAPVVRDAAPSSSLAIELDVSGAAEASVAEGGAPEVLEVAHYVTAGDLERHFTVIEGGAEPRVEVSWRAPRGGEAPRPMHFYGIVRDGRGGVTWVRRALCVR